MSAETSSSPTKILKYCGPVPTRDFVDQSSLVVNLLVSILPPNDNSRDLSGAFSSFGPAEFSAWVRKIVTQFGTGVTINLHLAGGRLQLLNERDDLETDAAAFEKAALGYDARYIRLWIAAVLLGGQELESKLTTSGSKTRKPYSDLTLEELQELTQSVLQIEDEQKVPPRFNTSIQIAGIPQPVQFVIHTWSETVKMAYGEEHLPQHNTDKQTLLGLLRTSETNELQKAFEVTARGMQVRRDRRARKGNGQSKRSDGIDTAETRKKKDQLYLSEEAGALCRLSLSYHGARSPFLEKAGEALSLQPAEWVDLKGEDNHFKKLTEREELELSTKSPDGYAVISHRRSSDPPKPTMLEDSGSPPPAAPPRTPPSAKARDSEKRISTEQRRKSGQSYPGAPPSSELLQNYTLFMQLLEQEASMSLPRLYAAYLAVANLIGIQSLQASDSTSPMLARGTLFNMWQSMQESVKQARGRTSTSESASGEVTADFVRKVESTLESHKTIYGFK